MKLEDLVPASALARRNGVKTLIYGIAGAGKTPLMATAPNPVILSIEKGLLSLADSNVPAYEATDWVKIEDFLRWWLSSTESQQFETLCIDSLSEMAYTYLKFCEGQFKNKMQAYGELAEKITKIVYRLHDDPRNLVCIAKIGKSRMEDGTEIYRPAFEGNKLESVIPHKFDNIFFLDKQGVHTVQGDLFHARNRSGLLDPIEQPNLAGIFEKIKNGRK